jgi:hypothetical protein
MLYDVINRIRQLSQRTKIAILVGLGLVVAALVALAIVDNVQKQNILNEVVEASVEFKPEVAKDPLSSPLRQVFGDTPDNTQGLYLGNSDVEVVARDGDWLAVKVINLDMSNYGSQYYAIYKKIDGEYRAAVAGSIINRDDYLGDEIPDEYRIPDGIFNAIDRHATQRNDGKLQGILANSPNKTYPIMNSLPLSNDFYKITYSFEDEADINSFYIYINALYGYNNAAVNRLINAGFDPGDYRIVFNYDVIKRLSE